MWTPGVLIRTSSLFLLVFLIHSQTMAFMPRNFFWGSSKTHKAITHDAILQTTADVCRARATQEGRDFVLPSRLTVQSLTAACSSPDSAKGFQRSIDRIVGNNAWVDFWHIFKAEYHFTDEAFFRGRDLITKGMSIIKNSVKQQSYEAAREKLGEILHTLQDFYSHSNWVEMGNDVPYSNMIKPSSPIDNIADPSTPTCRNCNGKDCRGNLLEEIMKQKKLTSGYFSLSSSKPTGKCSHGGFGDFSSLREPTGGINKDTEDSNHGYIHFEAAKVATAASRDLLEDIRAAVGDSAFLRLMGFTQNSVLCFVIDTTSSMSNDIAEVRRVTSSIIDSRKGTSKQPSEYILVPFNDPEFGPMTRTTDPDLFKRTVNSLTASGGGDAPEMCLSGLLLALTGSPSETEIFVFTDAAAKDTWLNSTVVALIERTKCSVSFMLTNDLSARRRRRNIDPQDGQQQFSSRLSNPLNEIYRELAQASGGEAIEVTKATLPQATSMIVDASSASVVTVFQAVRNTAKAETFKFFIDSFLRNLTIYITGSSPDFIVTSPSGLSQNSSQPTGALGIIQKVGNFHAIRPSISDQTGLWIIRIKSAQPYTVKAFGQSGIDFLFEFIELSDGPHPSYAVLKGRPKANSNVTLLVTMVGGDSVRLTDVALVETSTSNSFNGTLQELASDQFMVTIDSLPAGDFVVRVVGENSSSRASGGLFQRQSLTQLQASSVTITTEADGTLEPGKPFTLPFTVATNSSGGIFNISITNDRSFTMTGAPSTLTLQTGGSANGTVTLIPPGNAPSGSDVTVTIEAEAPGGTDSNYAVLRLSVVTPVTDITPPECQILSVSSNCSGNCSLSSWHLSANMTDRNGTGIQSVVARQGIGTLNTSSVLDGGVNVTVVSYAASCCFPQVELVVVDSVGNVAFCASSEAATDGADRQLRPPVFLWLTVGIISLYQFMQL